jgi:hypothetical protein
MGNELLIIDRSYTLLPVQIAAAGDQAARRFIEFFTANIRNPNTRTAYLRAVSDFFGWTDRVGLKRLETLEPVHVAAYIEQLGKTHSAPKRQATPGGSSDAVRLAGCRPGRAEQSSVCRSRTETRRQARQDADPLTRGGS